MSSVEPEESRGVGVLDRTQFLACEPGGYERIAELQQGFRDHPPYTSADRAALFADLQVRIRRIHAAEVEACEALAAAAG